MSLSLGSSSIGSVYLGNTKIVEAYLGSTKVFSAGLPALAPRSMRFDFKYDHFNPITGLRDLSADGLTWTHVRGDIYDFHYDNADWGAPLYSDNGLFNKYATGSTVYPMSLHQYDILDMDLTGVTSVAYLFNSAWQVRNILSIQNTSSVTDFRAFIGHDSNHIAITSIPLFDTSSATNMYGMFMGCNNLTSVPLFNTGNVTNMRDMFYDCTALTSVPLFNTGNVTTMRDMFYGCSALTFAPLFNTSNVTNMYRTFYDCGSLTAVPLFNTDNVTDVSYLFYGCRNVESGALALYQQMSSQSTPPSTHPGCFRNCGADTVTGSAELAQIPSSWGGNMA